MRLRQTHPHQAAAKINVTPLIDVVMVLIIFYLLVGKMAADRRARVELPSSGVGATLEGKDPVVVTVLAVGVEGKESRVLVDGQEVAAGGLANVLRARVAGAPGTTLVQVRADRRLAYGAVAPVVTACREAGLTTLRLVTERAPGSTGLGGAP